jgi:hypothetical protein
MAAVLVVMAAACGGGTEDSDTVSRDPAAQQASYERFDLSFHHSTASAHYAALYGGLLAVDADGRRAIDTLVGGLASDSTEFHLLQHDPNLELGRFLGVGGSEGAVAKVNRWFDRYEDGESIAYISASLTAFDTHDHATAAVRADLEKEGRTADSKQSNGGTEWLATFEEEGEGVSYLFWVGDDAPVIISLVCVRWMGRTKTTDCDPIVLRDVAADISGRLPAAGAGEVPPGQFGPDVIPPGLTPLVAHEFDADHIAKSYLDPDGQLRATWEKQPPAGAYPFTGRSTSYGFDNPEAGGPPMYVRIDVIPVGDTDVALKFSSTVCLQPDNSQNPYCGREKRYEASGSFLGGVIAVNTFDTLKSKPRNVSGHFVVGENFIDGQCSRALWSSENSLSDQEVTACTERMLALVRLSGGS